MSLAISVDEIVARSHDGRLGEGSGWGRVRLREVAQIQNGFAFKSAQFNKEDLGLPLVRIRDVGNSSTDAYFNGDYEERYLVATGELVVGMDGDFRASPWTGPTALLNQRVARIRLKDDARYDARFLMYVLPAYLGAINEATSSITVKHLSSRTLEDIPLPNPPLDEQQRIVAAIEEQFSRLDAGLEALTRAKRMLVALRSAGIADAVSAAPAVFLGDVVSDLRYGTSVKCSYEATGLPVLRIPNIQKGEVSIEDLKFATVPIDEKALGVRRGDLLFVRTNGSRSLIGRVACFERVGRFGFASYLIRARLATSQINPRFATFVLASPALRNAIESMAASSAGQYNLNLRALRSLRIPLPSLRDQERIVDVLASQASLVQSLGMQADLVESHAQRLRQAILREAFAGRLTARALDVDRVKEGV